MSQIFGKFYRFDEKLGNFSTEDIDINVVNTEDLEDCLMIFWVNGKEAMSQLYDMFSQEFLEGIGASVMVLDKNLVDSIDIVDITESEKITLRKLDTERAARAERKINRSAKQDELRKIIQNGEKSNG